MKIWVILMKIGAGQDAVKDRIGVFSLENTNFPYVRDAQGFLLVIYREVCSHLQKFILGRAVFSWVFQYWCKC